MKKQARRNPVAYPRNGRATAPQEIFLSFANNVPFRNT